MLGQKTWRKWGHCFRQCFSSKFYYFLQYQFSIHISRTHILLFFSIHILFFAHTLIYNSRYFFGRIINIIVYGRKRKTCINVLLSFSIHILSFAHIHKPIIHAIFSFGRIIIDIIVYGRKRKTCIIFRRKINGIVAWWFWKDINWHHCFMEGKERCVLFLETK